MKSGDWTWLEVAKLGVGTLTAFAVFFLTFMTNNAIRREEDISVSRSAVQQFSDSIFERRVRAELLSSSMRRYAHEPVKELMNEIMRRKVEYDDAYAAWNRSGQSNLMIIREVLGSAKYTEWEAVVDHNLVARGFAPLDRCLTSAYDEVIRGRDPVGSLSSCECLSSLELAADCTSTELIEFIFECGVSLTDSLFAAASAGANSKNPPPVTRTIRQTCHSPVASR